MTSFTLSEFWLPDTAKVWGQVSDWRVKEAHWFEANKHIPEGLVVLRSRLRSLSIPEDDDDIPSLPAAPTLAFVNKLLTQTASEMDQMRHQDTQGNWEFPAGFATTDDDGGIRIEWWRGRTHSVHLVVASKPEKAYIFTKLGVDVRGDIERPATYGVLAKRLHDLTVARVKDE